MRITSIYEGTSQLQVVAAIGPILQGAVSRRLDDYEEEWDLPSLGSLFKKARLLRDDFEEALTHLQNHEDPVYQQYHSRRLVDMAADTVIGYLLCINCLKDETKTTVADLYITRAEYVMEGNRDAVLSDDRTLIDLHEQLLESEADLQ